MTKAELVAENGFAQSPQADHVYHRRLRVDDTRYVCSTAWGKFAVVTTHFCRSPT